MKNAIKKTLGSGQCCMLNWSPFIEKDTVPHAQYIMTAAIDLLLAVFYRHEFLKKSWKKSKQNENLNSKGKEDTTHCYYCKLLFSALDI